MRWRSNENGQQLKVWREETYPPWRISRWGRHGVVSFRSPAAGTESGSCPGWFCVSQIIERHLAECIGQ